MAMPAQMEREDLAGARVLVVEDEFLIALEVEVLLRDFGCEVLGPVPSVVRALELLGRERPDARRSTSTCSTAWPCRWRSCSRAWVCRSRW